MDTLPLQVANNSLFNGLSVSMLHDLPRLRVFSAQQNAFNYSASSAALFAACAAPFSGLTCTGLPPESCEAFEGPYRVAHAAEEEAAAGASCVRCEGAFPALLATLLLLATTLLPTLVYAALVVTRCLTSDTLATAYVLFALHDILRLLAALKLDWPPVVQAMLSWLTLSAPSSLLAPPARPECLFTGMSEVDAAFAYRLLSLLSPLTPLLLLWAARRRLSVLTRRQRKKEAALWRLLEAHQLVELYPPLMAAGVDSVDSLIGLGTVQALEAALSGPEGDGAAEVGGTISAVAMLLSSERRRGLRLIGLADANVGNAAAAPESSPPTTAVSRSAHAGSDAADEAPMTAVDLGLEEVMNQLDHIKSVLKLNTTQARSTAPGRRPQSETPSRLSALGRDTAPSLADAPDSEAEDVGPKVSERQLHPQPPLDPPPPPPPLEAAQPHVSPSQDASVSPPPAPSASTAAEPTGVAPSTNISSTSSGGSGSGGSGASQTENATGARRNRSAEAAARLAEIKARKAEKQARGGSDGDGLSPRTRAAAGVGLNSAPPSPPPSPSSRANEDDHEEDGEEDESDDNEEDGLTPRTRAMVGMPGSRKSYLRSSTRDSQLVDVPQDETGPLASLGGAISSRNPGPAPSARSGTYRAGAGMATARSSEALSSSRTGTYRSNGYAKPRTSVFATPPSARCGTYGGGTNRARTELPTADEEDEDEDEDGDASPRTLAITNRRAQGNSADLSPGTHAATSRSTSMAPLRSSRWSTNPARESAVCKFQRPSQSQRSSMVHARAQPPPTRGRAAELAAGGAILEEGEEQQRAAEDNTLPVNPSSVALVTELNDTMLAGGDAVPRLRGLESQKTTRLALAAPSHPALGPESALDLLSALMHWLFDAVVGAPDVVVTSSAAESLRATQGAAGADRRRCCLRWPSISRAIKIVISHPERLEQVASRIRSSVSSQRCPAFSPCFATSTFSPMLSAAICCYFRLSCLSFSAIGVLPDGDDPL